MRHDGWMDVTPERNQSIKGISQRKGVYNTAQSGVGPDRRLNPSN
jgi:hypothetical protein